MKQKYIIFLSIIVFFELRTESKWGCPWDFKRWSFKRKLWNFNL